MILPLYKNKGDMNNPYNYRGIKLLSCIGKLFTAVFNDRRQNSIEATLTIGDEQAGCRNGFSAVYDVVTIRAIIQIYSNEKQTNKQRKKQKLFCVLYIIKKHLIIRSP